MRSLLFALALAGCADKAYEPGAVRGPADEGSENDAPWTDPDPADTDTGLVEDTEDTSADTEDTGEPPVETDDTGQVTDTRDTGDPPPDPLEACYPGPSEAWTTCLPLVQPADLGSDYVYPAPYGGDPQYREPIAWLDLDAEDPGQALAPNFVLEEFAEAWKGRWAVVQPHAVASVQAVRDDVGVLIVNSGYRSPTYNASVGGVESSRHVYGDGFDLDPASVSLDDLADACYAHGAGYVGYYATHIHCDWRDDDVDTAFFGAAASAPLGPPPPPARNAALARAGAAWTAPATGWDEGEPLREWTAYNHDGAVIDTWTGQRYAPPAGADRIEVVVGREVRLSTP